MGEAMLNAVWETVESLLAALESPQDHPERLTMALRGSLEQLLEYPPALVVERVQRSSLPTRALVSWLVHEAGRLDTVEDRKVKALRDYWETARRSSSGLISSAACRAVA